jgi:hypothetical protein
MLTRRDMLQRTGTDFGIASILGDQDLLGPPLSGTLNA